MKYIMLVDDSKTNRLVLKSMIKEYIRENSLKNEIEIIEAENGKEALDLTQNRKIDLIFMDIMMPVMDGIEATYEIRSIDKKVMIVAVSALDDDTNKAKILINGAEDYIVKPVNGEVLKRRLTQYLELIDLRGAKRFSSSPYNLLNCSIYSRRLTFLIDNDLHLSEFWEYYLISGQKYSEELSDLVKIFYGVGAWQLKLKYKFVIIVEESEESLYFTMNNMLLLNPEIIKLVISKNYPNGKYKLEDDKLTFSLNKYEQSFKKESKEDTQFNEEALKEIKSEEEMDTPSDELVVFDFLDEEDLEELESILGELNSTMLLVGSSRLDEGEVLVIAAYIDKIGRILSRYSETYILSQAVSQLSDDISQNREVFIERSKDIAMLCMGFGNDLHMWIRKLFFDGAPSIDFLDSSIISNANMISGFIKPAQTQADSLDDIFDF